LAVLDEHVGPREVANRAIKCEHDAALEQDTALREKASEVRIASLSTRLAHERRRGGAECRQSRPRSEDSATRISIRRGPDCWQRIAVDPIAHGRPRWLDVRACRSALRRARPGSAAEPRLPRAATPPAAPSCGFPS